ncbi:unnamed protein product [Lasius platythorax]|uniref:Uncharacterized protein n=1 Tax=Lasius platythorax TaxID=488582 RepID=A0AAV2MYK1_9HYME
MPGRTTSSPLRRRQRGESDADYSTPLAPPSSCHPILFLMEDFVPSGGFLGPYGLLAESPDLETLPLHGFTSVRTGSTLAADKRSPSLLVKPTERTHSSRLNMCSAGLPRSAHSRHLDRTKHRTAWWPEAPQR